MAKDANDILKALPTQRREKIERLANELRVEYLTSAEFEKGEGTVLTHPSELRASSVHKYACE